MAQSEASVISVHRSVSTARFFSRACPSISFCTVSTPRVEPMRQGVHLPQLSATQNSKANLAIFAMSVLSSNTTMPPWPSIALMPASAS